MQKDWTQCVANEWVLKWKQWLTAAIAEASVELQANRLVSHIAGRNIDWWLWALSLWAKKPECQYVKYSQGQMTSYICLHGLLLQKSAGLGEAKNTAKRAHYVPHFSFSNTFTKQSGNLTAEATAEPQKHTYTYAQIHKQLSAQTPACHRTGGTIINTIV